MSNRRGGPNRACAALAVIKSLQRADAAEGMHGMRGVRGEAEGPSAASFSLVGDRGGGKDGRRATTGQGGPLGSPFL